MPMPSYAIPPPSYVDGDGRPHYITQDGQPPNHGIPPASGFENPLHMIYGAPTAELPSFLLQSGFAVYSPPVDATPPLPFYTEDGSVYFIGPHSVVAEPTPNSAPLIQPLQTSSFRPPIEQYTYVNFIRDGIRPHRDRFTGRNRDRAIPYTLCKLATHMKMETLIMIMGRGNLNGITECKLSADGLSWLEVQTFRIGDDRSHKSLEQLGWIDSKGTLESPIWVCVYLSDREIGEEGAYQE